MNHEEHERLMKLVRDTYPLKSDYEELHEMARMSPWVWTSFFVIVGAALVGLLVWGRG
jgi:hypothetical protein